LQEGSTQRSHGYAMTDRQSTANILALARAGATARAWDEFVAAGLDKVSDAKALTLKGRLLKDRARKAKNGTAARLYLQSAKAYADAASLAPDSYPLINAATMSLFAGQADHMTLLAQRVLTLLDTRAGPGETAYWHEATRAEALLLLGQDAQARKALDKAIAAAPAAWEDRAATLRQFRQIALFRGEDADWLATYAPPVSLHFKGMMGIDPNDAEAEKAARKAVEELGAGFGFGALAAGADILIAEALIARGAELHVVLPVMASAFRAQSVEPYGAAWASRFNRLFEQAASVTVVAAGEVLSDAAIELAARVAKGMAIENAARLEGGAAGLEIGDSPYAASEQNDRFIELARSASLPDVDIPKGKLDIYLVNDKAQEGTGWKATDGAFVAREASLEAALDRVAAARRGASTARIGVSLGVASDSDLAAAKASRIAQSADPGVTLADAITARALLALSPAMRAEPIGELADPAGAVAIYAIEPRN
jgi:hypothetical protein